MAFLNSGNILHPILAKSQCWCVDGVSKFVLRIRANSYYRIELPHESLQDQELVEEFKTALAKVLQYEVTACPFKRGFTVELPEPPTTPIQKIPWRPKPRTQLPSEEVSDDLHNLDEATKENLEIRSALKFDTSGAALVDTSEIENPYDSALSRDLTSSTGSTKDEHESDASDDTGLTRRDINEDVFDEPINFKTPTRPRTLRTGRTVTAPPQLSLRTTPPSTSAESSPPLADIPDLPELHREPSNLSSSADSFHSFHSPISPLPPSPSFSNSTFSSPPSDEDELDMPRARGHRRDASEITVTADSPGPWDMTCARTTQAAAYPCLDTPRAPPPLSDTAPKDEDHWFDADAPCPPAELRLRNAISRRRLRSPLPSSTNLYSPYSPRSAMSSHHLTTAILQRTCSLLLGPPIQLVALMLRIAAKIATGALRGSSYGFGETGQKIPCSWDFSDGSDEFEDTWDEDDYGVSLVQPSSRTDVRANEEGGSWEID